MLASFVDQVFDSYVIKSFPQFQQKNTFTSVIEKILESWALDLFILVKGSKEKKRLRWETNVSAGNLNSKDLLFYHSSIRPLGK